MSDENYLTLLKGEKLRANDDGTVTLITASGGEHTYDPDDVFHRADEHHVFVK